jgi:hypothetical protein
MVSPHHTARTAPAPAVSTYPANWALGGSAVYLYCMYSSTGLYSTARHIVLLLPSFLLLVEFGHSVRTYHSVVALESPPLCKINHAVATETSALQRLKSRSSRKSPSQTPEGRPCIAVPFS